MDQQPLQSLEPGRFPPLSTLASKTDGACLLVPQRPLKCRNPAPLARRGEGGSTAQPRPRVSRTLPQTRRSPTHRSTRRAGGSGRGQAGCRGPDAAEGRELSGVPSVGGLLAAPRLPGRGRGQGARARGARRGCPLTPVRHLHSHVLPSDQSAPVCQQLLPDPDQ